MKTTHVLVLFLAFALALPLSAQMGMGVGPRMQDLSGIWRPTVGAGAAYDMDTQSGKANHVEITVVGKEDVNGKTGYWMEMVAQGPRGGDMFIKYLITPGDTGMTATRMIFQMAGQDPMEMDLAMMARAGRGPSASNIPTDIHDKAELVGSESVTVPAGTFTCEHYRAKDGTGDVWLSEKVAPWSMVKMQGKNTTMVLTKVITDAKDHITGTPKKFDPAQMMRQGGMGGTPRGSAPQGMGGAPQGQ